MICDFNIRHDIPNSKQPKIFKISESKNHMAVLHGRRANNYFPHTKEASPAAGNQRPFASGRLLDQLKKNRQHPLTRVWASTGYSKSTLLSSWLDLLHRNHVETIVCRQPP
jgi:hypothetical protein